MCLLRRKKRVMTKHERNIGENSGHLEKRCHMFVWLYTCMLHIQHMPMRGSPTWGKTSTGPNVYRVLPRNGSPQGFWPLLAGGASPPEIDAEGAPRTPSSDLRAPQPLRPPYPPPPHPLAAQDRFWGRLWVDFGDCAGVCMCDCLIANM